MTTLDSAAAACKAVDSYRFLDSMTRRIIKSWAGMGTPADIPWTPLSKPLNECTVAMVTSGGVALKSDQPFDQSIERKDPWYSDPSFRIIPRDTAGADVKVYHLHINPSFAEQDLNCILPLRQLVELENMGEIGRAAPSHYSYMGYTVRPQQLLDVSVPAMIDQLRQEHVDAVVLVPV